MRFHFCDPLAPCDLLSILAESTRQAGGGAGALSASYIYVYQNGECIQYTKIYIYIYISANPFRASSVLDFQKQTIQHLTYQLIKTAKPKHANQPTN